MENKKRMTSKTILITGASSGIGKAYAYAFAKKGDNLILVARSRDKLERIKADCERDFSVNVDLFVQDLSLENAAKLLFDKIKYASLSVDTLINNAGFATKGLFSETDFALSHQEMMLNVVTLTELCHLFSQEWTGQSEKTIINLASSASFQATPYSAVYAATKSYVLSLTEALNDEYHNKGIYYLAVCPGPTATAFFDNIGGLKVKMRTAEDVVATTFKALKKRPPLVKDGFMTKFRSQLTRIFPRQMIVKATGKVSKKYAGGDKK